MPDELNDYISSKGEDGIPQSIVAKALPVIAPFLTRLFNTLLTNGVYPPAWKKARIIALKKAPVIDIQLSANSPAMLSREGS